MDGHKRGCEGRNYTCSCGYDDECEDLRQLIQDHIVVVEMQKDEIVRLKEIEKAVKRLAYVVRKSVNSGPLSKDPTSEASAWRSVRIALGEGYDEPDAIPPKPNKGEIE